MKAFTTLGLTVLLTGCGSFMLGYVQPQAGKTAQDQQLDTLVCKDRAKTEANTSARQAGSFLAGMTIVGAPIAIEAEKAKQREVFTQCMGEKGYQVRPPT
jgi:hypothetical protein